MITDLTDSDRVLLAKTRQRLEADRLDQLLAVADAAGVTRAEPAYFAPRPLGPRNGWEQFGRVLGILTGLAVWAGLWVLGLLVVLLIVRSVVYVAGVVL